MKKDDNIKKPKLEEISKESPFKVPDHYFDHFSTRMADKISAAEQTKIIPVFRRLKPQLIFATSVMCLACLVYFGTRFLEQNKNKPLTSQELVEVYEYAAVQEMDDTQLMQQISKKTEARNDTIDSLKIQNIKVDNAIIDYLSKENIDINTIIDAL